MAHRRNAPFLRNDRTSFPRNLARRARRVDSARARRKCDRRFRCLGKERDPRCAPILSRVLRERPSRSRFEFRAWLLSRRFRVTPPSPRDTFGAVSFNVITIFFLYACVRVSALYVRTNTHASVHILAHWKFFRKNKFNFSKDLPIAFCTHSAFSGAMYFRSNLSFIL